MQLFLNTDTDIGIQRKMTAIKQEPLTLHEKFGNKDEMEQVHDDRPSVVDKHSVAICLKECNDSGETKNNENVSNNSGNIQTRIFENIKDVSDDIKYVQHDPDIISEKQNTEEQVKLDGNINLDFATEKEINLDLQNNEIQSEGINENNEINDTDANIDDNEFISEEAEKVRSKMLSENNEEDLENKVESDLKIPTQIKMEINEESEKVESLNVSETKKKLENKIEPGMKISIYGEIGKISATMEERDSNSLEENYVNGLENAVDSAAVEVKCKKHDSYLKENVKENMHSIERIGSDVEVRNTETKFKKSNSCEKKVILDTESGITLCKNPNSEIREDTEVKEYTLMDMETVSCEVAELNRDIIEEATNISTSEEFEVNIKDTMDIGLDICTEKVQINKPPSSANIKGFDTKRDANNSDMLPNTNMEAMKISKIASSENQKDTYIEKNEAVSLNIQKVQDFQEDLRKMNTAVEEISKIDTSDNRNDSDTKEVVIKSCVEVKMNMKEIEIKEPFSLDNQKISDIKENVMKSNMKPYRNKEVVEINEIVSSENQKDTDIIENPINSDTKFNTDMEVIKISKPCSSENQKCSDNKEDVFKLEEQTIENKKNDVPSSSNFVMDDDIIDIADEKDEECITVIDQEICDIEKEPDTTIEKTDIKYEDQKSNIESKDKNFSERGNNENNKRVVQKTNSIEKKKLSHICKLSNTLDILSDEDEEDRAKIQSENVPIPVEKQCINIEDDDDIMLIDEEISKDSSKVDNLEQLEKNEIKKVSREPSDARIKEDVTMDVSESKPDNLTEPTVIEDTKIPETVLQEQKLDEKDFEKPIPKTPLLPKTFLKTCKKNLSEMTRDDLEEFCILKIVESVVDRSKLTEISTQLKTMGNNIEEYKKKANTLMKQNRDLQVVLKSVQEEQKKCSNMPITPLKITRSVGMQVYMTEKSGGRKKSANNFSNNSSFNPNKMPKSQTNQNAKSPKVQANANNNAIQNIPVPRLVPAVNNTIISSNKVAPVSAAVAAKVQSLPNGVRNSPPIQKPEKRPHSKIQSNSVTVDLTDDEPPAKIIPRNVTPPVRLVSPQALLTAQRPQFSNNINSSPRKVYIPISGAQNQVRAGQTIMLKQVGPQAPRIRPPNILPKPNNTNALRMTRVAARHPAPLPDSMKQYQPPNWKALPPSPELKLSKVENGIVISWKIDGYKEENHEEIASYQLYAYQETSSPPNTNLWKKIGDVKALPLPMACTLTQFMAGYKYYFAVRAVDIRSRLGPFSLPGSILLLNKM